MSLELGDNAALGDSYTGLKQVGVLIFPFGPWWVDVGNFASEILSQAAGQTTPASCVTPVCRAPMPSKGKQRNGPDNAILWKMVYRSLSYE